MVMEAVKPLTADEVAALCTRHTLFDWSVQAGLKPLAVASAKGVRFTTVDGKRFIDFNSQLMCVNAGHGDRRIIDAIKEQAEKLAFVSPFMATEPRARLGKKLAELLPGDIDKVFFTLGGTDSAEVALAMLEETILLEGAGTIAAFILEPITGTNGILIPPDGYLEGVREICDRHGILLIADEVMTGFGRTGRRFAVDHWNVKPDILIGGKGLTGGYIPMGMIAVDEKVVAVCEEANRDFMFFTYSCHPLACAMGDGVLAIMEREKLVERAESVGARLGAQLKEELSGHPMVGDIRGAGFFWGIELVRDRERRTPYAPELKLANKVLAAAVKRGLFFYPSSGMAGPAGGDAMMITPPFIVNDNDIDFIVSTARAALDDVKPNLP